MSDTQQHPTSTSVREQIAELTRSKGQTIDNNTRILVPVTVDAILTTIKSDVIGEDDVPRWDSDDCFCLACHFQPTDNTRNCICVFRNKLRAEQRLSVLGEGK